MKKDASKVKQFLSLTTALSLALSLGTGSAWAVEEVPSSAGQAGEQEKTAVISLCDSRTFQFSIPVELTAEEAKAVAEGVVWSLDYDGEAGYRDIPDGAWYGDTVEAVTAAGPMKGTSDTTFGPEEKITREMVAATLYRLAGESEMTGEALAMLETTSLVYSDADAVSGWAKEAMAWAVETGALQGSGNQLMPGKTATRQELAAVLYRNATAPAVEGEEIKTFTDSAAVADWAADAMEWCVEEGILKGNENTLMPEGTATRAELAARLLRLAPAQD